MRQDVTMAGALGDCSKCCRDTSQKCGSVMAGIINEVALMGLPGQPVEGSEGESVSVLGESTT